MGDLIAALGTTMDDVIDNSGADGDDVMVKCKIFTFTTHCDESNDVIEVK